MTDSPAVAITPTEPKPGDAEVIAGIVAALLPSVLAELAKGEKPAEVAK